MSQRTQTPAAAATGSDHPIDLSGYTAKAAALIGQREPNRTFGLGHSNSRTSSGIGSTSPISVLSSSSSDYCLSPPPTSLLLLAAANQADNTPPVTPITQPSTAYIPAHPPTVRPTSPVTVVYKRVHAPDFLHDMKCIRKSVRPNFYTRENVAPPEPPEPESVQIAHCAAELDAVAALLQMAGTPVTDSQLPVPVERLPLDDPQRSDRYHGRGYRFVVNEVDVDEVEVVIGMNKTRVAWTVLDSIDFRDHCAATWTLMDALFTRAQQQCRWHVELECDKHQFDPAQLHDVMEFVSHVCRVHVKYVGEAIARKCEHELVRMGLAAAAMAAVKT